MLSGSAGFALREDGGFAGSLTGGLKMWSRTALIADLSIMGKDCELVGCTDDVYSMGVLGIGLRSWLGERWWVRGSVGLGFAELRYSEEAGDADGGLGWTAGAGFDLYRGPSASLDLRIGLIGVLGEHVGPVRGTFGVGLTL